MKEEETSKVDFIGDDLERNSSGSETGYKQKVDVEDFTNHNAAVAAEDVGVEEKAARASADEAYMIAGEIAMDFTKEEEENVKRKLDKRIPAFCAAVYFLQFMDKTLLNYASITGLPIKGLEYNQVSAGFYYGFMFFVFPSAWLSQRFPWGVTKYLGLNVILWGITLALSAISPHFAPFFVLRILLGMFESTVTPILLSTIVAFYRKEEQATRICVFYSMNGLTQVIGPLIAYGTTYGGGAFGESGAWRLLYIIFGILTVIVGVIVTLFMPNNPMAASFLNDHEKRIALERVRGNASGTAQRHFKWSQVKEAVFELRIWLVLAFVILTSIPNGGLSSFSSKILKGFGYSTRQTLLIGMPKGAFEFVIIILSAWLSDRYSERMLPIMIALIPTIVGAAILVGYGEESAALHHRGAVVFAVYLTATFGASLSIVYAWNATNIGGSSKKTAAYAANMFAFGVGNIAGSFVFRDEDAPQYIPGKSATLVSLILAAIVAVWIRWLVSRANARKRQQVLELQQSNGWNEEEVQKQRDAWAFRDLTDGQNPFFIYAS